MFTSGCTCHTTICCSEVYDTFSTNIHIVFVSELPKLAVSHPSIYPTFYRAGTLKHNYPHAAVHKFDSCRLVVFGMSPENGAQGLGEGGWEKVKVNLLL